MHFIQPKIFLKIVPPSFPSPLLLVYLSGIFEILGGIGLLFPMTKNFAIWGLIFLLIAVFPANIYMAKEKKFAKIPAWVRWGRLPHQFFVIWWLYSYL
ncbi:MAG: DoxX family protein [Spirosomataceae bacterium]